MPLSLPHIDQAQAAFEYAGTPRRLVTGLKFGTRLQLAVPAATAIAFVAEASLHDTTLIPVPPSPTRSRRRGFDSADLIAAALARRTGLPLSRCLARSRGPRQVGRVRAERIADPPRVRAITAVPAHATLVDDVVTTGATLAACARALRDAGAQTVNAVAFAHST